MGKINTETRSIWVSESIGADGTIALDIATERGYTASDVPLEALLVELGKIAGVKASYTPPRSSTQQILAGLDIGAVFKTYAFPYVKTGADRYRNATDELGPDYEFRGAEFHDHAIEIVSRGVKL